MFGLDRSIGETTSPLPITILPQLETIFMRFRGSKTLRDKCDEEPQPNYRNQIPSGQLARPEGAAPVVNKDRDPTNSSLFLRSAWKYSLQVHPDLFVLHRLGSPVRASPGATGREALSDALSDRR